MKILMTGATGFIGGQVLRDLLAENHQVTVAGRNLERLQMQFPELRAVAMDFSKATDSSDWLPHLHGIDAVINAVGIIRETRDADFETLHYRVPAALFSACAICGIKKVVQISALGAEPDAETGYFVSKAKADAHLQALDLDWWILKPSLVFGKGAKSLALLTAMASLPVTPLPGSGAQRLQPVAIEDLSRAIGIALRSNTPARRVVNAVGPRPMRFDDLLAELAAYLGRRIRLLAVSERGLGVLLPIAALLGEPILNRESLAMLQRGNSAEAGEFAALIEREPQSLRRYLRASSASQAERWHARLYFLRPLLTLSIAVVWLWTGWISAFVYPAAESYQLLGRVGIEGVIAPWALYGASLADFALGIAVLRRWRLRRVVAAQIAVMFGYMGAISLWLPEYWLHPFGPLIKNLPLLAATLVMLILEEERP